MRFRPRTMMAVGWTMLALAAGFAVLTEGRAAELPPGATAAGLERAAAAPLRGDEDTVVSFLQKNCLGCHSADVHRGGMVLETYKDMASICRNRKTWARVLTMVQTEAMPPPRATDEGKPRVPKDERAAFVASTKAILSYVDPAHPDPGRVTMRRLNRIEYANSVRDLLGVKFDPSADFPPDDVGAGFDNNGDVLTLSPLLMEHYFTASEVVMEQALPEGGSWPVFQKVEVFAPALGDKGSFKSTNLGREKFRHLLPGQRITYVEDSEKKTQAKKRNSIRAENMNPIEVEGDYYFRALAYRHEGGGLDVPTMQLEVDDQVVGTFKVEGIGYDGATFFKAPAHLTPGAHKFAVAWPRQEGAGSPQVEIDPTGKAEPPGLHVMWTEVVGPRVLTFAEKTVLAHQTGAASEEAAREVIGRFAARAFRRPATEVEVSKLMGLYQGGVQEGLEWAAAVRRPIQAVLLSPDFLFRVETDEQPEAEGQHAINDYQLAARLSYFLWSSLPDEELTALAAKNELHNQLEAQVRRMLTDPRAEQLTDNFAAQWLHLRMLAKVTPDKERYPEYTPELRSAMATETLKFFGEIVCEDRSILDLLDGNFTYLNEPLAALYGIVDTKGNWKDQEIPVPGGRPIIGPDFVRVELQGPERGGVLTQASVLTVTSNPGRTSPVKRGKFVLDQILGEPPPPPPPNVPSLDLNPGGATTGNVRQRMEAHRADPHCAACHVEMDAIGFAFEHFDPIGRFRSMDGDYGIDAAGALPGGSAFDGAAELKAVLKQKSDVFADAFTRQLLTYALGRQVQYFDKPAVDRIVHAAAADQYRFSRVVLEIVNSDPFRMRRGKDHIND